MVWEKYASFKLRWKKMDDMKSYMDTITGWLTSSEIINKRIQDELTDVRTHSMKTNLIISFNKKNKSYREQPDELSTEVAKRFFAEEMQVPGVDDLYIPVSHRVGRKSTRSRALLVQLPMSAQLSKSCYVPNRCHLHARNENSSCYHASKKRD